MAGNNSNFFDKNKTQITLGVFIALVLAVYWQTVGFEFINFDDNIYVYQNQFVTGGLTWINISWAFTEIHSANWHPLTWLSHQLDVQLFGLNAGSHHATNVLFHLINTVLAFTVFRKFTGSFWKSAIVAALFAVHPAHVESVAWVAERKDVLSTMFWLLTMIAYWRYAELAAGKKIAPETGSERVQLPKTNFLVQNPNSRILVSYFGVLLFLLLGLMAKPMLVTLPFVLLLTDVWPLERLKSRRDLAWLLVEKIPLFALAAASAVVTVIAQRAGGAVQTLEILPFGTRLNNAVVAYANYLLELIYPVHLAVWYPYVKGIPAWQVAGAAILLTIISVFCLRQFTRRKYLLIGWLWFVGTMVPVIGLVQVGLQSHADRYTYVPYFGLFIIVVWGADDLIKKFRINLAFVIPFAIVVIVILAALSFRQVSFWRNDESLYRHSIAVTTGNFLLMQNYCHALIAQERLDEAEKQCRDSIAANPVYPEALNSLGIIQIKRQQYVEAAESIRKAISANPRFPMYKVNLAIALSQLGQPEEAERNLQEAAGVISYNVHTRIWVDAIKQLAISYARQNNLAKAEENFGRALSIAPDNTDIRSNYALTLYALKKYDEAQRQIEESIRQNPALAESFNIYGAILAAKNERDKAIEQYKKALELNPNLTEAKNRLDEIEKEEKRK